MLRLERAEKVSEGLPAQPALQPSVLLSPPRGASSCCPGLPDPNPHLPTMSPLSGFPPGDPDLPPIAPFPKNTVTYAERKLFIWKTKFTLLLLDFEMLYVNNLCLFGGKKILKKCRLGDGWLLSRELPPADADLGSVEFCPGAGGSLPSSEEFTVTAAHAR